MRSRSARSSASTISASAAERRCARPVRRALEREDLAADEGVADLRILARQVGDLHESRPQRARGSDLRNRGNRRQGHAGIRLQAANEGTQPIELLGTVVALVVEHDPDDRESPAAELELVPEPGVVLLDPIARRGPCPRRRRGRPRARRASKRRPAGRGRRRVCRGRRCVRAARPGRSRLRDRVGLDARREQSEARASRASTVASSYLWQGGVKRVGSKAGPSMCSSSRRPSSISRRWSASGRCPANSL